MTRVDNRLFELVTDARSYHVVVINERAKTKTYVTTMPVTHKEGCTILGKLSDHRLTRKQLEEVAPRAETFSNLENFLAESFLRVDDRAVCCAMRPGESVTLGVSTLTRRS